MLDRLQRKILRRSKLLGEHIGGLEVRRWDMNWNLDYSVGKNRDTLEGFFSVVSEPICAIKEVRFKFLKLCLDLKKNLKNFRRREFG